MKLYAIVIETHSGFGTPLKGDTLFGQFCWEVAMDPRLIGRSLDECLESYKEKPFVVFSSAFPRIPDDSGTLVVALRRPAFPVKLNSLKLPGNRCERFLKLKEEKKKRYFVCECKGVPIDFSSLEFLTETQLMERVKQGSSDDRRSLSGEEVRFEYLSQQPHNTINRLSGTTGAPPFAPYSLEVRYYPEGSQLVVLALIDDTVLDIRSLIKGINRIGCFGFGKDASTGKGKFRVVEDIELPFFDTSNADGCYTLSPCVPDTDDFKKFYFTPFIRFGRHGNLFARANNPFKNPVIMADEAAVFIPAKKSVFDTPFIGRAVNGVSKVEPRTVVQGYSIYLPINMENTK